MVVLASAILHFDIRVGSEYTQAMPLAAKASLTSTFFILIFFCMSPVLFFSRKMSNEKMKFLLRFGAGTFLLSAYILLVELSDERNAFINEIFFGRYHFLHAILAAGVVTVGSSIVDRTFKSIVKVVPIVLLAFLLNFGIAYAMELTFPESHKAYSHFSFPTSW